MEINTEALKIDLEYWKWVAPDWADCYVLDKLHKESSGFGKATDFGWESPEMSWYIEDSDIEVIPKPAFEKSVQFIEKHIRKSFISELKNLLKKYDAEIRTQTETGFESSIEVVLSLPHKSRGKMVVNFGNVIYGGIDEEEY
jgi:hypothetical protein